ncbi:hypothetical protein Tco_1486104 [Tanacetum coccineum]
MVYQLTKFHVQRVDMVINPPWNLPFLGAKGLTSPEQTATVIMEYLVKISKKARILELKRRHLKITVLTSNTPYPSKKIRRICACTSLKTTKEQDPIRHI